MPRKKICIVCKKTLSIRQRRFCSKRCKNIYHNAKRPHKTPRICSECNKPFKAFWNKKTCSKECSKKRHNRIHRIYKWYWRAKRRKLGLRVT